MHRAGADLHHRAQLEGVLSLRPALLLVLLLALPGEAAADWLVVKGGEPIETQGPWEVEGKLVVFRTPGGELASLRLDDVDLEASHRMTAAAARRARAKAASGDDGRPKRRSVLVLTDRDFPRARVSEPSDEDLDSDSESSERREPPEPSVLQVTSWDERELSDPPGLELVGRLRNTGTDVAAQVRLTVVLQDRVGGMVGSAQARLESTTLLGGRETTFRAAFPGIYSFQRPQFHTQSIGFESGQGE